MGQVNKNLKRFYHRVYRKGETKHYTELIGKPKDWLTEEVRGVLEETSWKGKAVLDVGCGTGRAAYEIAKKGAQTVLGIDYAPSAVAEAQKTYSLPNLEYRCLDVKGLKGKFDVVVSLGTLEHMDDPGRTLENLKRKIKTGGSLIVTCPNWTNPRGYILQTLRFLFKAPVTLADIHYLTPLEFEAWSRKLKMPLRWRTVDQDWAHGGLLVKDFMRRIPNVLRDAKLPRHRKNIIEFIEWIRTHVLPLEKSGKHSGATGVYHFRKKS